MSMSVSSLGDADHHHENDGYEMLLQSIQATFDSAGSPLFVTNAEDLWSVFLAHLPENARQHYNCRTCRNFVERFGDLVRIHDDGQKSSAVWGDVPKFFKPSVDAMLKVISKAKVIGVFVSSLSTYGNPTTHDHKGRSDWYHMTIKPPLAMVWKSLTLSDSQRAAEKSEDFKTLISGLLEYKKEAVTQALKLLRSDSLYRSEKVLGVAEWLYSLHEKRNATKNTTVRENITWLAVATAPAGFCHIKSSMIGTLLDDVVSGMDFDSVSRRFSSKMHPLQYQRPQAAPSAGNIAQAEKIIEQLNAAGSLDRRFARLEELNLIWKPEPSHEENKSNGVFGHLAPKNVRKVEEVIASPVVMTWEKFAKTVLPTARSIEFYADTRHDYSAITAAVNIEAPLILQWDNPFAWYYKHGSHAPHVWNLSGGWVKVNGVCFSPTMWGDKTIPNHPNAVHFVLEGAKDTGYQGSGNAIFPETLKAEFHGIRSTIEAYSRNAKLEGYDEASACGVRCASGNNSWNVLLCVVSDIGVSQYRLDRWD